MSDKISVNGVLLKLKRLHKARQNREILAWIQSERALFRSLFGPAGEAWILYKLFGESNTSWSAQQDRWADVMGMLEAQGVALPQNRGDGEGPQTENQLCLFLLQSEILQERLALEVFAFQNRETPQVEELTTDDAEHQSGGYLPLVDLCIELQRIWDDLTSSAFLSFHEQVSTASVETPSQPTSDIGADDWHWLEWLCRCHIFKHRHDAELMEAVHYDLPSIAPLTSPSHLISTLQHSHRAQESRLLLLRKALTAPPSQDSGNNEGDAETSLRDECARTAVAMVVQEHALHGLSVQHQFMNLIERLANSKASASQAERCSAVRAQLRVERAWSVCRFLLMQDQWTRLQQRSGSDQQHILLSLHKLWAQAIFPFSIPLFTPEASEDDKTSSVARPLALSYRDVEAAPATVREVEVCWRHYLASPAPSLECRRRLWHALLSEFQVLSEQPLRLQQARTAGIAVGKYLLSQLRTMFRGVLIPFVVPPSRSGGGGGGSADSMLDEDTAEEVQVLSRFVLAHLVAKPSSATTKSSSNNSKLVEELQRLQDRVSLLFDAGLIALSAGLVSAATHRFSEADSDCRTMVRLVESSTVTTASTTAENALAPSTAASLHTLAGDVAFHLGLALFRQGEVAEARHNTRQALLWYQQGVRDLSTVLVPPVSNEAKDGYLQLMHRLQHVYSQSALLAGVVEDETELDKAVQQLRQLCVQLERLETDAAAWHAPLVLDSYVHDDSTSSRGSRGSEHPAVQQVFDQLAQMTSMRRSHQPAASSGSASPSVQSRSPQVHEAATAASQQEKQHKTKPSQSKPTPQQPTAPTLASSIQSSVSSTWEVLQWDMNLLVSYMILALTLLAALLLLFRIYGGSLTDTDKEDEEWKIFAGQVEQEGGPREDL